MILKTQKATVVISLIRILEADVFNVYFNLYLYKLEIEEIKAEIERQSIIGSRQGIEIKPTLGEGDKLDLEDVEETDEDSEGNSKKSKATEDEEETDYKGKFAMYYARILFFAFLTNSRVKSLQDVLSQIEPNTILWRIRSELF